MYAIQMKLLALSLFLLHVTAYTCTGLYAVLASQLVSYQPAKSFCSSRFPVPTVTSTKVVPTVTSTQTVSTATSLSTTNTFTTTTATSTYYVTSTEIIFVTVGPPSMKKRTVKNGSPTPSTSSRDARASLFNSIILQPFIGSICTCLEGQATKTTTSTPRATSLVTATVTITTSATLVETTYITITSSILVATTTTTTSSAPPPAATDCTNAQSNACGAGDGCLCSIDTTTGAPECWSTATCTNNGNITCNTDADCVALQEGTKCAYAGQIGDDYDFCGGGTICLFVDGCPTPNAKRELEAVFKRARRGAGLRS